jgi:hypothetical protein
MMRLREDDFVDTIFAVGRDLTFTAQHTGELICFANDAPGLYWNNKDNLTVVVQCQGPCKQIQACNDNQGCIDRSVLPVKPLPSTCFNYSWIVPYNNMTNSSNASNTTTIGPPMNCTNGSHWGVHYANATGHIANGTNCSIIHQMAEAVVCCNSSSKIVGQDWHHNTTNWQLTNSSTVFTHTAMIVMHNGTHAYILPRNETVNCSIVPQTVFVTNSSNTSS